MEQGAGNTILGAAFGAFAGLVLARKLGGADVRGALRGVALTAIAIGALGGGLSTYFIGQKKTNAGFVVLLITVVAMLLVALGIIAGPDTLRDAAQ